MIQSLFILSPTGEILIERHFRGVTPRSVCDHFWERASVSLNHHGGVSTASTAIASDPLPLYDTVPPIMEIPMDHNMLHHNNNEQKTVGVGGENSIFLFSILRDGLSYLAACPDEISPLLVIEFLHRIADMFVEYFGSPADESAIKDNFSTVYQLLEEMVDYGWPLTTEPNALQSIIRPPDVMGKLLSVVTGGVSDTTTTRAPSGTLPNIPWRRAGVRHNPNEIYLDIVEEVDAVLDAVGNVISFDVAGCIQIQSKLSGIPDLLLTFKDPTIIDDCSFHPCVRYARYETDSIISFVPPDGNFTLMRYRVKPSVLKMGFTPPIICTPSFRYETGGTAGSAMSGMIEIKLSARSISTLFNMESRKSGVMIEEVSVTIPFPKIVKTANLKVNFGQVLYDEASKIAKWTVGNLDDKMNLQLTGEMKLESTRRPDENPPLGITWKIPSTSLSGLSVGGLSVTGEYYKPYKGVRNISKSGRFQIRCN